MDKLSTVCGGKTIFRGAFHSRTNAGIDAHRGSDVFGFRGLSTSNSVIGNCAYRIFHLDLESEERFC